MDDAGVTIKYAALVIFLIALVAVIWVLKDGFPIGRGSGAGPITEGRLADFRV